MARAVFALSVLLCVAACTDSGEAPAEAEPETSQVPTEAAGNIERVAAALDDLIAPDAVIEKIADGFQFIEGPVWVDDEGDGYLLFSDIPANQVLRWTESDGVSVFLDPVLEPDADTGARGGSNGLLLDADGRLLLCEHGNRRIARMESDFTRSTVVDSFEGKKLNSPNDAVFHSDGSLYFTDPPYGLAGQDDDPNKEVEHNGIYRLAPDGSLQLLAHQTRPNGIGLSPDEQTLYVANSDAEASLWMAYPVEADGTLGEGSVFYDATSSEDSGVPDGLAVDSQGNVWGTGPGGVWVLSPEGEHLGTVKPAEVPANAAFGGDGKTLYMTARTGLYRLRVEVEGLVF